MSLNTDEFVDVNLSDGVIEFAKIHEELKGAFLTFQKDAEILSECVYVGVCVCVFVCMCAVRLYLVYMTFCMILCPKSGPILACLMTRCGRQAD